MEREAALADLDAARQEWEDAFARVPDDALTYLKPGDDYSLGGLLVHVNWVLVHYQRVLEGLVKTNFAPLGPQDPPGAQAMALDGARRGLTSAQRGPALEEMARLHATVSAGARRLRDEQWTRKAEVVYSVGEDPYPTCAEDIIGWLREHYREHVAQTADLVAEWGSAHPSP